MSSASLRMKGELKARSCLAVEARATFHLDRDVRKVQQVRKALLIRARSLWMIGYHRDDSGHVTGTNAPKVKVRNLVAMRFEPFGGISSGQSKLRFVSACRKPRRKAYIFIAMVP